MIQAQSRSKNVCPWKVRISIHRNYLSKFLKFDYSLHISISNVPYWWFEQQLNISFITQTFKSILQPNIFLGDYNIELLKYESSKPVNSFLDIMSSNFLSPQIILPTRLFSSFTLIDNIFCNLTYEAKSIYDNLASAVSDHLPQFLILPEFLSKAPPSKYNIYTLDWKKFDEEKFIFSSV